MTANSLPSSRPAVTEIQSNAIIQPNCTLTSCIIQSNVIVGAGSVIMEGAIVETGAVILPGSVVPPGRLIPANEVWGGNPVRYVRDLKQSEQFNNYVQSYVHVDCGRKIGAGYEPWDDSYLFKESSYEEANASLVDYEPNNMVANRYNPGQGKHYIL